MRAYPEYLDAEDAAQRIVRCIDHELSHGGDFLAGARAVVRDIELGYIKVKLRGEQNTLQKYLTPG